MSKNKYIRMTYLIKVSKQCCISCHKLGWNIVLPFFIAKNGWNSAQEVGGFEHNLFADPEHGGGGGGGGGGILNFNTFWGFQKNKYFLGYEDFEDIFWGSSQNLTIFRGHFYAF